MATRHGSATVTTPGDREIVITRVFEAPAALIWDALTTPALLLRWWGPEWAPLVAAEVDLRVGGDWRYVCRREDASELAWHGTYRELERSVRIVSTEVFDGFPDAESLNTMTLTESNDLTTLRTVVLHSSRDHRDGHIESGMESGMQETFNRLDDLLESSRSPAEQFRQVAGQFSARAHAVPAAAWDNPSPCEGWSARDVLGHMVEWMPGFLGSIDVPIPAGPSVAKDPPAAWDHLAAEIQSVLDDPEVATREFTHEHLGTQTVEVAIGRIMTGDILIHTWDLARATGGDERLDPGMVHAMLDGIQAMDEVMRSSGQYGPKVSVATTADEQTQLIAFMGRTP